jgi:hypothetical protein
VPAADEHAEALAAFFRKTWDPAATAERVRANRERTRDNDVTPGQPYPTYLALADGEVVAYLSSLPARFWIDGTALPGWWAKGLMVVPDYRNGPLGALLVREQAKHLPVLGSLAVNAAALRLFTAAGLAEIGPLSNRLIVLRPGRVLRRLDPALLPFDRLGGVLGRAVRLATHRRVRPVAVLGGEAMGAVMRVVGSMRPKAGKCDAGVTLPPDVDRLWGRSLGGLRAGVVRDRVHFARRYGAPAEAPYAYVSVRRAAELVGLAVVRKPRADGDPRLSGIRVAVLSEALFDSRAERDGTAVLSGAAAAARDVDADALLVSGTHDALNRMARACGAVSLPGTVHCLIRVPGHAPLPPGREWWVTRGDGDADTAF